MALRRASLCLGCVTIVASVTHRVSAGGPLEVEGQGIGGTEAVQYGSCNGAAGVRLKYGGLGGEIRYRPEDEDPPAPRGLRPANGTLVSASIAGALERHELLWCNGDCAGLAGMRPGSAFLGAARVRAGYDGRWFGFHVGPLLWQGTDPSSTGTVIWPDLNLRVGPRDVVRGEVGFGAYGPATLLHPGLYAGLGVCPAEGWDIVGHYGIHMAGRENAQGRGDIEARMPVGKTFQIGLGAALTEGIDHVEPEARALVSARF